MARPTSSCLTGQYSVTALPGPANSASLRQHTQHFLESWPMDGTSKLGFSACPHDCPSTCALEIELPGGDRIGRVYGAKDNTYTDGVICAKVARYGERAHHPERLMHPLRRTGSKGANRFERISWDDALDITAEKFLEAEQRHGAEAVWPYYFAGTRGLVMRDGINRLRHAKKYSNQHSSICTTL